MLRNFVQQGKEKISELKTEILKYKSKDFLRATMASSALVAFADGIIDEEEKTKMMAFIRYNDMLSVYNKDEVIEVFTNFLDTLQFDFDVGKAKAMCAIGQIKDKPEQARLVMRMAIAIGASDGDFNSAEQEIVKAIAMELNVNFTEFGLA